MSATINGLPAGATLPSSKPCGTCGRGVWHLVSNDLDQHGNQRLVEFDADVCVVPQLAGCTDQPCRHPYHLIPHRCIGTGVILKPAPRALSRPLILPDDPEF